MEDALKCYRSKNAELSSKLEVKDKRINLLEGQLRSREQKYHDDLKNVQRRIGELENQLDNKANTIAYLTSKIQQKKNKSLDTPVTDDENEQTSESSGLSNIKKSFSPNPPLSFQVNPSSHKRREYNLRRSGVSPSPSKAGIIQDGSSLRQLDFVLQNTLPKANSTTTQYSTLHTNNNKQHSQPRSAAVGYSETTTRRGIGDKELKFANVSKPKPCDYEDFLQISQPEIVQKSAIEPLPPITTRSGRQLRNPIQTQSRRLHNRQQAPRATASGEVETVIVDSISSPEQNLRRSVQQNSLK